MVWWAQLTPGMLATTVYTSYKLGHSGCWFCLAVMMLPTKMIGTITVAIAMSLPAV